MSLQDYFNARLIVDPFGTLDCSLNSDGEGAVRRDLHGEGARPLSRTLCSSKASVRTTTRRVGSRQPHDFNRCGRERPARI